MKVKELYEHITKHITPEEALLKLLEGSLLQYDKLKFDSTGEPVHPVLIISMATMDMGWNFVIEKNQKDIRGILVGTEEYLKDNIKK